MACRIPSIESAGGSFGAVAGKSRRDRVGFTLAESLIASVVLAIAVVGVSGTIIASQSQNQAQEQDSVAIALARQLMEEIASRPLDLPDGTPGWPTVTNRSNYDTIDDYKGYTDEISSTIYASDATTAENFTSAQPSCTVVTTGVSSIRLSPGQYSRTVAVSYPTTIFGTTVSSGDLAVVSVTVTGSNGVSVKLKRVFGKLSVTR